MGRIRTRKAMTPRGTEDALIRHLLAPAAALPSGKPSPLGGGDDRVSWSGMLRGSQAACI